MSSRCVRPPPPCSHLQAYRSGSFNDVERWKTFRTLHRCVQVRPLGGRAEIRRNLDEVLRCGSCGSVGPRLYACLACAAISCHRHAPAHTESNCPAPEIAVDIDRAELFCCVCVDQVYDVDFDVSIVLAQKKASPPISTSSSSTSAPSLASSDSLHKRRRVEYRPWSPDPEEEAVVRTRSSPMPFLEEMNSQQQLMSSEHTSLPLGLRGLNNLGSTCFMNSVLQALLHTPPLRNYFLSDRHNRYRCREQSKCSDSVGNAAIGTSSSQPTRNGVNAGTKNGTHSHFPMSKNMCLVCDLDVIYSDVFSGGRAPYSPAKLLYSWWQHASNLASYEQQDAHEFFISMLDAIHELAAKDQKKPHLQAWSKF